MKISCAEFDQRLKEDRLTLCLIGMSGMGKSYRAQQLANYGFKCVCCDDLITERMSDILPSADIVGLAAWMGQPYTNGYSEREARYLQFEDEVTHKALEECSDNTVINTTGSVIYLPEGTLQKLKEKALILYLEANQGVRDEMFQVYMYI